MTEITFWSFFDLLSSPLFQALLTAFASADQDVQAAAAIFASFENNRFEQIPSFKADRPRALYLGLYLLSKHLNYTQVLCCKYMIFEPPSQVEINIQIGIFEEKNSLQMRKISDYNFPI